MKRFFLLFLSLILLTGTVILPPAITAAEATPPYPESLVSHWGFDEGTGNTTADLTGTNNGTVYGATWTKGVSGKALYFDGTDDYVLVPDSASLDFFYPATIEFWVYPMANKNMHVFDHPYYRWAGFGADGTWGLPAPMHFCNRRAQLPDWNPDLVHFEQIRELPDAYLLDEWTHYVLIASDNFTRHIYRNGIEITENGIYDAGAWPNGWISDFLIGTNYGRDQYFCGVIDELTLWNRALTEEEILYHYQDYPVRVSINAPANVPSDADFIASVDINHVEDLNAVQYDIFFEPTVLRLDDITDGMVALDPVPVPTGEIAPKEISPGHWRVVQHLGLDTVSGGGFLSKLHFHVTGPLGTDSQINIQDGILSGFEDEISALWESSFINVSVTPGDVNADGSVNVIDMTKTARIILETDPPNPAADANQDGDINVLDMTEIAKMILELPPYGPAPPDPELPKYGGTFSLCWYEPAGFDPYNTFMVNCGELYLCNEELLMGDWTKTPAGTGEAGIGGFLGLSNRLTGQLCESWSMPDPETLVFNIRQGVHWQNKAPVYGREYDAYDAAWAVNHLWEAPMGAHRMIVAPDERIISANATDQWTLEVKVPPQAQGIQAIYTGAWLYQYPREVTETFGSMDDWHNVVGTGPYILSDYVPGSALRFDRNPDYWQYDPLHPDNRLPYLDRVKWYFIPDSYTQLAAFRTGQLDTSLGFSINHEDGDILLHQHPEMHYVTIPGTDNHLYFRVDNPELPFTDLRVRQALTLAINKEELINDYYSGEADLLGTPYPPDKTWEPFYTPLEEMPAAPFTDTLSRCSVRELFYHSANDIQKAETLLSEAGYPDGFQCEIVCSTADTDFLSIIKEYFAVIDVDMEIQALEGTVLNGIRRTRSYEQGIYTASPTAAFPYDMHSTRIESFDCFSFYENPVTRAAYNMERQYLMKNDLAYSTTLKNVTPFILEQCVGIWCPLPRTYRMWWLWVQNYHGEFAIGCDDELLLLSYIWIDQNMKTIMGY
ncbi:MAG: hypothetical protein JW712_07520 [Dehalococcoidales bacterium]|nr:hypothetical protein [Dehalococcoidales bacterium]